MRLDPLMITKELISTPSPSGGEGDVAYLIKDLLLEAGIDNAFIDRYGNVIGLLNQGVSKPILFEGHMDHVPPGNRELWKTDPFKPVVIDGKLYGRGSVDMKGAIASMIASVRNASKIRDIGVVYVFVPHEEISEGTLLSKAVEETLGVEPSLVILGEATNLDIHRGHRGRSVIRIDIYGKSAHAAMPWDAVNPLRPMGRLILRLDEIVEHLPSDPVLGRTTTSPTAIGCEPSFAPMTPDHCYLLLDARLPPQISRSCLLSAIGMLLSDFKGEYVKEEHRVAEEEIETWTGIRLEVEHYYPGWIAEAGKAGEISLIVKEVNPLAKIGVWKFSTDGVYTAGIKGFPTIGIGPGDESLAHKPDEYVPVRQLYMATEIYSRIALKWASRTIRG